MKKALLILHGFAGSPKNHENLIAFVKENSDVSPFIFVMPGHQESEICKATREDYLNKTEEELQKIINMGYDDITIYGFSMGGSIATYMATIHPEITRLIIAAPSYAFSSSKEKIYNKSSQEKGVKSNLIESNARLTTFEFLKRFPIAAEIEFLKLRKFCNESIPKLNIPTLYMHGDKDPLASKKASSTAFYLNRNANKTYLVLNGATHDIYASQWQGLIYDLICRYVNDEELPLGYFENTDEFLKEMQLKR